MEKPTVDERYLHSKKQYFGKAEKRGYLIVYLDSIVYYLTPFSTHFHQDPLHIPAYLIKIFNHFFFRYQMYK